MNEQYADIRFEDIEDKGFLEIPSFLSSDEIEFLLADFHGRELTPNKNYNVVEVSPGAIERIRDKLASVTERLQQATCIDVDVSAVHVGIYFASEMVSFGWHQDHESYYELQNHYDYLNFFIPIQKPVKEKGNLRIIPWDALEKRCPAQYRKLVRSGGNDFSLVGGKTLAVDDSGLTAEIPFDLDEIGYTPNLSAGDLLLLRGDIIHQTQDADTKRIAMSVRLTNPKTPISRRELLTAGRRKTYIMRNDWDHWAPMIEAFRATGKKTMTWAALRDAASQSRTRDHDADPGDALFRVRLLMQKIAAGALYPSLKCRLGTHRVKRYVQFLRILNRLPFKVTRKC